MTWILYAIATALLIAGAVLVYWLAYSGWRNDGQLVERPFYAYVIAAVCAIGVPALVTYFAFLIFALVTQGLGKAGLLDRLGDDTLGIPLMFVLVAPPAYLVTFLVAIIRSHSAA